MPFLRSVRIERERVADFDAFPWSLAAVRGLDGLDLDHPVVFFVGENGSGKSTVMEGLAVALGLNPEGGSQNMGFATRETHSELHEALRPVRTSHPRSRFFLRAESFYNVATHIDRLDEEGGGGARIIGAYGGTSLHEQSHGESFLATVVHRFGPGGLYLLDEPEAALSPQGIFTLMRVIHDLTAQDAQFIAATHSPVLLGFPGAVIYELSDAGFTRTVYEDTEHYRLTRAFLDDPQRFLHHLFAD